MLMVGTMLSGSITEKVGCLWTLRLAMAVEFSGWVLIMTADPSFHQLIVGRILNGLGCGLSLPAAYMMLTDISLIRFRGIFAVLNSSACNIGFLIGLFIGAFASFQTIAICGPAASLSFLLVSTVLPESPLWLIKHGREDRAQRILQFIRGPDYPVHLETKEMIACTSNQEDYSFTKVATEAKKREFVIPFFSLFFLVIVQGLCGSDALSYYSVTIFKRANVEVDEYLMAVFLQIGFTAGYIFIAPFMDMIDRRRLFMTASSAMILSLAVLGVTINGDLSEDGSKDSFNVTSSATDDPSADSSALWRMVMMYVPPVCVILYSFSYGAGFGPAIYTWTSEIFPAQTKSIGCSICLGFRNVIVFASLKCYPTLISCLGLSNIMYLHSATMVAGLVFVRYSMPETRGLSMSQITALFQGHGETTLPRVESPSAQYNLEKEKLVMVPVNNEQATPC